MIQALNAFTNQRTFQEIKDQLSGRIAPVEDVTIGQPAGEIQVLGEDVGEAAPGPIPIPFFSIVIPADRMKFTGNPAETLYLDYFPREALIEYIDFADNLLATSPPIGVGTEICIYGIIGTGKSHILAAYCVYEHCRRHLTANYHRRVVYISNCRNFHSGNQLYCLQAAFKFAFPEDAEVINCWASIEDAQRFAQIKIDQEHFRITYIVDDWNYYLDSTVSDVINWKRKLQKFVLLW